VDGVGVFCVVDLEGVTVGGWEGCMIWLVDLGVFIGMRFGWFGWLYIQVQGNASSGMGFARV
jgi:hypothetical protein